MTEVDVQDTTINASKAKDKWDWTLLDLSEGGTWHQAHVASLQKAVTGLPVSEESVYKEGLEVLKVHHQNSRSNGAIYRLQLLWREFPTEH
jgi:hypothetical protein